MKVGEIRATGLTAGEIQDALEHADSKSKAL